jgi:phage terminase large subunit-like protein
MAELTAELLAEIEPGEREFFLRDFSVFAHSHQLPPDLANNGEPWTTWLILGGRGAGKTRAGAEWVRAVAISDPKARIALVGETERDTREVMVEGMSGLLAVHPPHERPQWVPSRRQLEWPNGALAQAFSAEDPESLRGPQFSAAWCDELAKWRHAEATFDMLQFGLRLGERPRQVMTTTPRPVALLKRLIADPSAAITRAGTIANACNLAPSFIETILSRYSGTRLGRQEIDGEIIEQRDDALWSRGQLDLCRIDAAPLLTRIVVAVDPPGSAAKQADACGLVAAGRGEDGSVYVLADETAGVGGKGDCVMATPSCRRAGGGGQFRGRHGARSDRGRRPFGACHHGAGNARQICARRTGGAALRAGAGQTRRRISGARR